MFVPHNCANCVCRNERASCFLAPRIMFVLVFWARVLHHICLRMHIHTRVYVTKNKLHAHGHARRHMCRSSVAGLGPQAPCGIRPRLLTNPEPHTWFLRALRPLHLAPESWQGLGPCILCQRRPRPNTGPTCTGIGTSSTNTGQGRQGGGQGNKAPSWQERRHW